MIHATRKPALDAAIEAVSRDLAAHDLMVAEVIAFETTMAAMMAIFSGDPIADVRVKMRSRPEVVALGRHLEGLSAAEVMHVHTHARLIMWATTFATMPATLCGRQWAATLEKAALGDDAKLN